MEAGPANFFGDIGRTLVMSVDILFCGTHPARVMMYHVIEQHNQKLNPPHSLITNFWKVHAMEGDYIPIASDRGAWKDLTNAFLQWHNIP